VFPPLHHSNTPRPRRALRLTKTSCLDTFIRGMMIIPWVLSLATALWFSLMARRAGRNWLPWALAGAVIALVIATIVLGLGNARCNPFSNQQRIMYHIEWAALAVAAIAIFGWICTMSLHRHHLVLWRKATGSPAPAPGPSAADSAKPKLETPKQPSSRS
jgi:hypothetical protein